MNPPSASQFTMKEWVNPLVVLTKQTVWMYDVIIFFSFVPLSLGKWNKLLRLIESGLPWGITFNNTPSSGTVPNHTVLAHGLCSSVYWLKFRQLNLTIYCSLMLTSWLVNLDQYFTGFHWVLMDAVKDIFGHFWTHFEWQAIFTCKHSTGYILQIPVSHIYLIKKNYCSIHNDILPVHIVISIISF